MFVSTRGAKRTVAIVGLPLAALFCSCCRAVFSSLISFRVVIWALARLSEIVEPHHRIDIAPLEAVGTLLFAIVVVKFKNVRPLIPIGKVHDGCCVGNVVFDVTPC